MTTDITSSKTQQHPVWRLLAVMLVALIFGLGMTTFLGYYKFKNALTSAVVSRLQVVATGIERGVQHSIELDINLSAMNTLPARLFQAAHVDDAIISIDIVEPSGRIIHSTRDTRQDSVIPPEWRRTALRARDNFWQAADMVSNQTVLGHTLRNNFDIPVAIIVIRYSTTDIEANVRSIRPILLNTGLVMLIIGGSCGSAAIALLFMYFAHSRHRKPPQWSILTTIIATLIITLLALIYKIEPTFDNNLLPEMLAKAKTLARSEGALIQKALDYNIPIQKLWGINSNFQQILAENPDLAFIQLRNTDGKILAQQVAQSHGSITLLPWLQHPNTGLIFEQTASVSLDNDIQIQVGVNPLYTLALLQDMALDLLVILVVTLFISLEIIHRMQLSSPESSLAKKPENIIRAPLFIFFLAEELLRSFLPNFVSQISDDISGVAWQIVVGLPITIFMLCVALSQTWLTTISDRYGRRKTMTIGAWISAFCFIMTANAYDLTSILLWRAIGALGYAIVFVGAQGFILDRTQVADRSRGFALLISTIMVAAVCGPSIGGILADNIGARATLLIAAGLAFISALSMTKLPADIPSTHLSHQPTYTALKAFTVLKNKRFTALCLLAAVPAKILLTGFGFYLLPLYITSNGGSQATAGRLLMIYAIIMVVLTPSTAYFADHKRIRIFFVTAGLIISALGGLLLPLENNLLGVTLVVVLLGLGQAMSMTSQSVLVGTLASTEVQTMGESAVYGVYRTLERMGNAVGPMFAATLLSIVGFETTFVLISIAAIVCALLFFILLHQATRKTMTKS